MPLSIEGRPDEARALATVHAALDAGVTLLDTADSYHLPGAEPGHNERLVARALSTYGSDTSDVLVTTKGGRGRPSDGSWTVTGSPRRLKSAAEASLKRLGVDAREAVPGAADRAGGGQVPAPLGPLVPAARQAGRRARACPVCGVLSAQVKGTATTRPRDLPHGARDLHLSWPTVMDAFRTVAAEVAAAALEPVEVLGIDETRRGRTQWRHNPDTGRWEPVADQWHTGFVDAHGAQGLLGQVEGRAPADVLAWLATTPQEWRKRIRYVAIDMSTSYRAAVRTGLPHATVVVDHFHVVQLRNQPHDQADRPRRPRLPTSAYAHAASPPAEPADTSAPLNFEDPTKSGPPADRSITDRDRTSAARRNTPLNFEDSQDRALADQACGSSLTAGRQPP